MADQTRRQFLKLLGRGAGASVIPKNPLLNVFKQRALTGTPIQNESVRIMQELQKARGTDRWPLIFQTLQNLGLRESSSGYHSGSRHAKLRDLKDQQGRDVPTVKDESGHVTNRPQYGHAELAGEEDHEEYVWLESHREGTEEPQALLQDARYLSEYLDATLPEDFGEGFTTMRDQAQAIREEAGRATRTGVPGEPKWNMEYADKLRDILNARREKAYFPSYDDEVEKYQQELFKNHPFYAHSGVMYPDKRADDVTLEQIAAPENVERNRESLLNALSTAVGVIPQGRLAKGAVNIGTKLFKQFMKRPPKREEAPTGKQLTHYDRGDPVMLEKLPGDEVYTDTRSYNPTQQAISNSRFDVRPEQSELKVSEQAKDIISGRIRGVVSDKEVQDFVRSKSNKLDNTLLDELQEAIDLDKDIPF